jgi:hypothetical protein
MDARYGAMTCQILRPLLTRPRNQISACAVLMSGEAKIEKVIGLARLYHL